MAQIRVVDYSVANHGEYKIKEWTEWHTNLKKLLDLITSVVEDDHEQRRLERKSGNAKHAEVEY